MRIVFCGQGIQSQPWLDGLQACLPGAEVYDWVPGAPVADYAVLWSPPQQFLDQQTALKAMFVMGAGVDALIGAKLPAGVPLVRLDDAGMSVQMAEFVCHAVIRHVREFDVYSAGQASASWAYRRPRLRQNFPIGVMGLGVLGERVSRTLAQFDFPVNGWSRSAKKIDAVNCYSGASGLAEFLAASRILVCLLPLTPATENILNRDNLARLLPDAYLINVARGAHLVEQDLLDLLASGQLAGAALDVFRSEPLPAEHAFWTHPKISVTPHISARTLRQASIQQIAGKISALAAGASIASLAGVVDTTKGY